jgi:hypothetical protein
VQHIALQLNQPLSDTKLLCGTLAITFRMGYHLDFKWSAYDGMFIPQILNAMRLARGEPDIQEKGLASIGTLCSNCRGNKNDMVDLDGGSHVCDAMDAHSNQKTIQEAALCCLQFFTDTVDRKCATWSHSSSVTAYTLDLHRSV